MCLAFRIPRTRSRVSRAIYLDIFLSFAYASRWDGSIDRSEVTKKAKKATKPSKKLIAVSGDNQHLRPEIDTFYPFTPSCP